MVTGDLKRKDILIQLNTWWINIHNVMTIYLQPVIDIIIIFDESLN